MIRLKEVQDALMDVVGWENGYGENFLASTANTPELTKSESGLTFQAAHPLLTLENIRSIMPADYTTKYPEFTSDRNWWPGEKMQYKGNFYYCREMTNESPDDYPEDWMYWNPLNDFLEDIMRRGINTVVQSFLRIKELNYETRSLFDRRALFDGAARLQATIMSTHRLVGFEFVPVRSLGVTTKIERVGLQMIGNTGEVHMYLFHSSRVDPVKEFTLYYTNTKGGIQWFEPYGDIYLPYIGVKDDQNHKQTDAGGSWYLCYLQDSLPVGMEALNVAKDWSAEPCGTCNRGNLEDWRQMTKYLQISPFCVQPSADFAQNPQMWDVEKMAYTSTVNYGINCEISIGCDLTDFIIQQRGIFASVIQKQIAYDALRTMALNPDTRVNRNQSNVARMDILYELDGNTVSNHPGGLGRELKESYKALEISTKGLDRICLKCHNGGVKYRTA